MSAAQRFAILLTVLASFGLPTLALMFRITVLWTRSQDRISGLATDLQETVEQARDDRRATNERLTWLERNAWGPRL